MYVGIVRMQMSLLAERPSSDGMFAAGRMLSKSLSVPFLEEFIEYLAVSCICLTTILFQAYLNNPFGKFSKALSPLLKRQTIMKKIATSIIKSNNYWARGCLDESLGHASVSFQQYIFRSAWLCKSEMVNKKKNTQKIRTSISFCSIYSAYYNSKPAP